MTPAQQQKPQMKPAKSLEEWQAALQEGEVLRLQERFAKEAKDARPRRAAETDEDRRLRFQDEFAKARAQVDAAAELRKTTKRKRGPAAVAGDAQHFSTVQTFLQSIRRGVAEGLVLPAAMSRAHAQAAHVTNGGACDACGDAAQALTFALGDVNLFPSIRGEAALAAVDKALVLARPEVVRVVAEPRATTITISCGFSADPLAEA